MTKVLCPPVMPLLITIASHLGIRIWRESRKGGPVFITAWSWIPDGEIIKGGKANNYAKIDTAEGKKK